MNNGITFSRCLQEVGKNRAMLTQADRLMGTNLCRKGAPIDLLIDRATGREALEIQALIHFVYNYVWLTFDPKFRGELDMTIIPLQSP